jgi:dihydrofolate reductase
MGLIHIDLFTTLDLVAQAPGGPDEDAEGGFEYGGWQAPLFDEVVGEQVGAGMAGLDALLLGRKTYDIFAAYWPHQEQGVDAPISRLFNEVPKYVVSRSNPALDWAGSTLLGSNLASAVRDVRDRHANVHVIGSIDLTQTLLTERLYDRLNLWVFPIVLGRGKKVFADGAIPTNLTLAEPPVTSKFGAVLLRYALADGTPATGDMTLENRGA